MIISVLFVGCMEISEGIQKRLMIRDYFPVIRRLYGDLRGFSNESHF